MHAGPHRTNAAQKCSGQSPEIRSHGAYLLFSCQEITQAHQLILIPFRKESVIIATALTTLMRTAAQRHVRFGLAYVQIPLYIAPRVIDSLPTSTGRWYGYTRKEKIAFDYNGNLIIQYECDKND